jgi:hypothetical protein
VQERLDLLAAIRTRALTLYPGWGGAGSPAVQADIAALRSQVETAAVLIHAGLAIERDARLFEAYARDYQARHGRRQERTTEARARLEAHAAWGRTEEAVRDRLRRSLDDLACGAPGNLTAAGMPDGRCPGCHVALGELETHLELLETREAKARAELDALLAPRPPHATPGTEQVVVTMELNSPTELPRLYERIAEAAKVALTKPRRVRVTFEDSGS